MRIIFDQGTPVPLRSHLKHHSIDTVYECGWSNLENGELLDSIEQQGYELLITTDQNLRFQQNLSKRTFAVLVLLTTSWPKIAPHVAAIGAAVDQMTPGEYREFPLPS